MICPTCGANIPDGSRFCTACGSAIGAASQQAYTQSRQYNPSPADDSVFSGSPFVDPGEQVVATLENGFTANLLSGEGFLKEDAYVTNKRIYYNASHGILNKTKTRNIIDLSEVTGTKLADVRHYGFLVLAVIALIAMIFMREYEDGLLFCLMGALVFAVIFFVTMKKHLRIEYAGGFIYFSVRKYSMNNVIDFQKAIYQQKDALNR